MCVSLALYSTDLAQAITAEAYFYKRTSRFKDTLFVHKFKRISFEPCTWSRSLNKWLKESHEACLLSFMFPLLPCLRELGVKTFRSTQNCTIAHLKHFFIFLSGGNDLGTSLWRSFDARFLFWPSSSFWGFIFTFKSGVHFDALYSLNSISQVHTVSLSLTLSLSHCFIYKRWFRIPVQSSSMLLVSNIPIPMTEG